MTENPVQEWLRRVAHECGDPDTMLWHSRQVANENTKVLMAEYARRWLYNCTEDKRIKNMSPQARAQFAISCLPLPERNA